MKTLFAILMLIPSVSFASRHTSELILPVEYQAPRTDKLPYEMELNFVKLPNARWTRAEIVAYMKGLAEVYVQCGVGFSTVKIYTVESPVFRPEVEKYQQDSEFAIGAMSDQTSDIPRPAVYLIDQLTDSGEPTGQEPFAKAWYNDFVDHVTRTHLSLVNTIWFPYFVNSTEYTSVRNYNGLAHELTHILTLDGLHNDDPVANLMILYIRKRRNNYILPRVCSEIQASTLVKKSAAGGSSGNK